MLVVLMLVLAKGVGAADSAEDARAWLLQAWRHFENREWEKSRAASIKALTASPDLADAEVLLGLVATAQTKLKEAEEHFLKALDLQPQDYRIQGYLGSTYLRQKRFSEARRAFQKVLQKNPSDQSSNYNLGLIALIQQKPGEALSFFESVHRMNPSDLGALIGLVETLLMLNRAPEAKRHVDKIEALLEPRDPRLFQIATLLAVHQAYGAAIKIMERIREVSLDAYDVNYNLALAYLQSGNYDRAAEVLQPFLSEPNPAEAHNLLATIEERRHRTTEAGNAFRKAAELNPSNEDYQFDYANHVLQYEPPESAIAAFAAGVKRFPESWRMQMALGSAFYLAGKYEESVRALLMAGKLEPKARPVYFLLGRVYEFAESLQPVIAEAIEAHLNVDPDDPWAHYYYGFILFFRDRADPSSSFQLAKNHLNAAIALDANFAEAHLQLGMIEEVEGQVDKSIESFKRAVQSDPTLAAAHYRLALAYQRVGDNARAETEFGVFKKLKSETPESIERRRVIQSLLRDKKHGN